MAKLDRILNPRYEATYDKGDCVYDKVSDKLYHVDNAYIACKIAREWNDLYFSNPNHLVRYHDSRYCPVGTISKKIELRNMLDGLLDIASKHIKQAFYGVWEGNDNLPFKDIFIVDLEDNSYELEITITKKD